MNTNIKRLKMFKFKKLHPEAKAPTKGSEHAAGYDLYIVENVDIKPGCRALIKTGIAIEIPHGYQASIQLF